MSVHCPVCDRVSWGELSGCRSAPSVSLTHPQSIKVAVDVLVS